MFDPSRFILDTRWGYVMRHEGADYYGPAPWRVRLNPLRLQIGIGRRRPCWLVINRGAWLHRAWSDFTWRLWRKRRFEARQRRGR